MRTLLAIALAAAWLLMSWQTPPLASAASEASLAVIVHASNPTQRLSRDELEVLFTRSRTRWEDGVAVVPLNAPAGSSVRNAFDGVVLRLSSQQVGRFWLDRRIRGLGLPPRQVPDPVLARRVVETLRGAIAYVPEDMAVGKVKVMARIRQGSVVLP